VRDGCGPQPDGSDPPVDLAAKVAGAETTVERWPRCRGGAVELWTIRGGDHGPELTPTFGERILDFLAAHPRP
jgi:hypothetical protein